MNEQLYLAIVDKLEKPDSPLNDLLIEAVGNDDGTLRDAIYRITLCGKEDLPSTQEILFKAFAKYFDADKIQAEIDQKELNDLCSDLVDYGRYSELAKDWVND